MAERMRLRAAGAQAVEDTWRNVVPTARLNKIDPQRFAFEWASAALTGLTVVAYDLEASVRAHVEPADQLIVCRLITDDGGAWDGEGPFDGFQPWLSADRTVHARWSQRARVHNVVFDRTVIEGLAGHITGDDRRESRRWSARPVSAAAADHWQRTYHHLAASLLPDTNTPGPVAEAELRRHAIRATLTTFSPSFLENSQRSAQRRAAPVTVRRALAFIEENAHEPITVDDVASAVGISTRGLQYAFRRALDTTPTDWLRQARLSGAHQDLTQGDGATVAEVAKRWGFEHPSRFAARYRAVYGVNPGQTLRAHR